MPRSTSAKRAGRAGPRRKSTKQSGAVQPAPETIISVEEFTSPKTGKTYRVVETNQMDAYDQPAPHAKAQPPARAKKKRGGGGRA